MVQALEGFPEDSLDLSSEKFWNQWKDRWSMLGDKYLFDAGNSRTMAGSNRMKMSASACYHWSEFMFFSDKKLKFQLRNKARNCFWEAFNEHPYLINSAILKFGDTSIPCSLILPNLYPNNIYRYPCVILSNGLDSMTEIEIFSFAEQFLSRGIAVLLFDGPGQGINIGKVPLPIHFEDVVEELLKFLSGVDEINSDYIGFFGVSFGGYLALRVAHYLGHHFRCVVNLSGGPYLTAFDEMPRRLKEDFQFVFCEDDRVEMNHLFNNLNLLDNYKTQTKILSIHGDNDDIFPVEGLKQLDQMLADHHKLIIYNNEPHVCLNRINQYSVILADWVAGEMLGLSN
ncbi:MAG: esterase FrsA [Gammaproteobacteria bacterium]|nr:esterase FrsA [Gammaproteobacteria bacterium]